MQVLCAAWDDALYKKTRCPPQEFEQRYGRHGIHRVWRRDSSHPFVFSVHVLRSSKSKQMHQLLSASHRGRHQADSLDR